MPILWEINHKDKKGLSFGISFLKPHFEFFVYKRKTTYKISVRLILYKN